MKKLIVLSLILFSAIISGCSDSDETPLSSDFAVSALVTYDGEPSEKFEFENDGTKYTQVRGYYNGGSGPFPSSPSFTFNLIYDSNNQFKEAHFVNENNVVTQKYIFEASSNSLKRITMTLNESTGEFEQTNSSESFYLQNPEDGYYIWEDALFEYSGGNMVGIGYEAADGSGNLDALEKNWDYYPYLYDDKPNVLTNYALSYAIMDESFERSRNENNLIGYQWNHDGSTRRWTLNIDDSGRLTSFIHEATGRTTTFEY